MDIWIDNICFVLVPWNVSAIKLVLSFTFFHSYPNINKSLKHKYFDIYSTVQFI
jgi:hypothetical protein